MILQREAQESQAKSDDERVHKNEMMKDLKSEINYLKSHNENLKKEI